MHPALATSIGTECKLCRVESRISVLPMNTAQELHIRDSDVFEADMKHCARTRQKIQCRYSMSALHVCDCLCFP